MSDFEKGLPLNQPGIYVMDEDEYHQDLVIDGSLSCSEARLLLDCPARYRWRRDTGPEHRADFDFGHAAHSLILGVGAPVDVLEFDDWRTKASKEAREESYAAGRTPVLAKDWAIVEAMADVLRRHPIAARLLDRAHGQAEQSMFWRDPHTGIMLRARLDWLPEIPVVGRLIVPDYKTTKQRAERRTFGRSSASLGYHQQAAWYLDGVEHVLGISDAAFVFIVQEKDPPYIVSVFELDSLALLIGRERNRRAIDLYVECTQTGRWPTYSDEVELVSLPRYAEIAHEEDLAS